MKFILPPSLLTTRRFATEPQLAPDHGQEFAQRREALRRQVGAGEGGSPDHQGPRDGANKVHEVLSLADVVPSDLVSLEREKSTT